MIRAIAMTCQCALEAAEIVRVAIVTACALALIAAGQALPF